MNPCWKRFPGHATLSAFLPSVVRTRVEWQAIDACLRRVLRSRLYAEKLALKERDEVAIIPPISGG